MKNELKYYINAREVTQKHKTILRIANSYFQNYNTENNTDSSGNNEADTTINYNTDNNTDSSGNDEADNIRNYKTENNMPNLTKF